MTDTRALIIKAVDVDAALAERHEAFGEIVRRFQDMAFGCAYAVLGDFCLAEDVAQEAFLTAWRRLAQLQQPEAFPGWFRRIVLTECHRLTRGKRLAFVPLEHSHHIPAADDPYARAERRELRERVLAELGGLPEGERLVTALFYVGEYSQQEISRFLELPVATIVKRLYSARQRLKRGMLKMIEDDLQSRRPSRSDAFAERVRARLRPFAEQDWGPVTALYGLEPDYRADNEVWLRNRQQFDESRYVRRHYVAEHAVTKQILGYGSIEQTIFRPRFRLFLMAEPEWLRAGVGDLLLDQLTRDLRELNAILVWHRNYARLTGVLGFLAERGFSEAGRAWDLRLDVAAFDPSRFEATRERVVAQGIEIVTYAEESGRDPECLRKLHTFLNAVKADDPSRQPFTPEPFEAAERWCASAAFIPDACFVAKRGGEYLGFTDLINYEVCAGGITQGFTGVARAHRRQGLATAMKLRAIEYARRHAYQTVRSLIYPTQASVLALNEKLGFRRAYSYVTLEKYLKEVSRVDPRAYEAYVGEYAPDPGVLTPNCLPAAASLTIKQVGEHLISELRDMQDRLLPESETTFFTTHHYGRIEFVKDACGEVTHLIYREPGFEARARKTRRAPA